MPSFKCILSQMHRLTSRAPLSSNGKDAIMSVVLDNGKITLPNIQRTFPLSDILIYRVHPESFIITNKSLDFTISAAFDDRLSALDFHTAVLEMEDERTQDSITQRSLSNPPDTHDLHSSHHSHHPTTKAHSGQFCADDFESDSLADDMFFAGQLKKKDPSPQAPKASMKVDNDTLLRALGLNGDANRPIPNVKAPIFPGKNKPITSQEAQAELDDFFRV